MTEPRTAAETVKVIANYDPGLGFWRIFGTICGFLCLWLSIAAFFDLGDTSPMSWIILILGLSSIIEYFARFQAMLDKLFGRRWLSNTICGLTIPLAIYGCYRTAVWIYQ